MTGTPGAITYLLIALGGALGALARYIVGSWVRVKLPHSTFPWGTFVINISGCFVLGLVGTLIAENVIRARYWAPLLTIGFVGAYTTFSTFEYETAQLASSWRAMGNLIGSVVVGYGAVWLGIKLAYFILALQHHHVNP